MVERDKRVPYLERVLPIDVMKHVISATLSDYEAGTKFYTRKEGDLRDRLTHLYLSLEIPLIRENLFRGFQCYFERDMPAEKKHDRDMVRANLSHWTLYGAHLGLINLGYDYDFEISSSSEAVRKRERAISEAKAFLGEEKFNFFRELPVVKGL